MPYLCDTDDGNPANMLVTNLDDGSVLALCGACFPDWVQAMAIAFTPEPEPVDPDTDEPTDEPTDQHSAPVPGNVPVPPAEPSEDGLAPVTAQNGSEGPKRVARHAPRKTPGPEPEESPATATDHR